MTFHDLEIINFLISRFAMTLTNPLSALIVFSLGNKSCPSDTPRITFVPFKVFFVDVTQKHERPCDARVNYVGLPWGLELL